MVPSSAGRVPEIRLLSMSLPANRHLSSVPERLIYQASTAASKQGWGRIGVRYKNSRCLSLLISAGKKPENLLSFKVLQTNQFLRQTAYSMGLRFHPATIQEGYEGWHERGLRGVQNRGAYIVCKLVGWPISVGTEPDMSLMPRDLPAKLCASVSSSSPPRHEGKGEAGIQGDEAGKYHQYC